MRFDSAEFLIFFLVVCALTVFVKRWRLLLIAASYTFYSSWNPPFLILLLFSTAIDFQIGKTLHHTEARNRRRLLFLTSIGLNLGLLAYFKYVNFFLDNLIAIGVGSAALFEPFYVEAQIPLGISFYTFQTLSYSIDMYRRRTEVCEDVFDFALYVSFFPQLIAGPILRAAEFIPQIRNHRPASLEKIYEGIELCLVGLFKKVVIADNFALLVDAAFGKPADYDGLSLLISSLAFSAQIYCDFSAYSTMARGLALILGFRLPRNFNYPLLASSPIDYRQGWHITMGSWFRDYLYHPLGGDRKGLPRALVNTIVVWAMFGFWHGAAWSFLLWGMYNGLLVAGWRTLRHYRLLPPPSRWTTFGGYLVMPFFIVFANIFFRAESVSDANTMLYRIFTMQSGIASISQFWFFALGGAYLAHWASYLWYREGWTATAHPAWRYGFVALMLSLLAMFAGRGEPFYYFQF